MKFSLTIFLLLIYCISFSQEYTSYYNYTATAEWHFENKRYDSANVYFLQAFDCDVQPKTKDAFLYARSLAALDQTKKAFKFLKKDLKKRGGLIFLRPNYDNFGFTEKQIFSLKSIVFDTIRADYQKDMETNRMLEQLKVQGQKIRKLGRPSIDSVQWVENGDTIIVNYLNKFDEIDEHNFVELKKMIDEGRFKGAKYIYPVPLHLITIHMEYQLFREIEGDLLMMVNEGVFDPFDFASAKDRHYVQEAGDCLYYYAYVTGTNAECISYEDVVANRIAIGLSPYYSRTSIRRYFPVGIHGKTPLRRYFEEENIKMKRRAGIID